MAHNTKEIMEKVSFNSFYLGFKATFKTKEDALRLKKEGMVLMHSKVTKEYSLAYKHVSKRKAFYTPVEWRHLDLEEVEKMLAEI